MAVPPHEASQYLLSPPCCRESCAAEAGAEERVWRKPARSELDGAEGCPQSRGVENPKNATINQTRPNRFDMLAPFSMRLPLLYIYHRTQNCNSQQERQGQRRRRRSREIPQEAAKLSRAVTDCGATRQVCTESCRLGAPRDVLQPKPRIRSGVFRLAAGSPDLQSGLPACGRIRRIAGESDDLQESLRDSPGIRNRSPGTGELSRETRTISGNWEDSPVIVPIFQKSGVDFEEQAGLSCNPAARAAMRKCARGAAPG